jgi:hypothetical protein
MGKAACFKTPCVMAQGGMHAAGSGHSASHRLKFANQISAREPEKQA